MIKRLLIGGGAALLFPILAFAAATDVTLSTDVNITSGGITYALSGSGATIESITVSSANFSFVLLNGSSLTIQQANGYKITHDAPSSIVTSSTCTENASSTVSFSGGATSRTVTVEPDTSSCAATTGSGGGGGSSSTVSSGGGGGGGGGGSTATTQTTTTTATTPASAAAPQTTQTTSTQGTAEAAGTAFKLGGEFGLGAKGADVITLQSFLESKGFLTMPVGVAKGTFGALTRAALRAYQRSASISATGYVGPKTLAAINAAGTAAPASTPTIPTVTTAAFTRDLKVGMTGDDVKALQVYLNAKGYTVAQSGPGSPGNETTRFGSATRAALIKLQAAQGISPAAGYFGAKTRAYVNANP